MSCRCQTSSAAGKRPCGIRCFSVAGNRLITGSRFRIAAAVEPNGNPFSSSVSEGVTISDHFKRPQRSHSTPIPAIIPGGPTACGPCTLALSRTEQRYSFSLIPFGPPCIRITSYIVSLADAGAIEFASRDQTFPVRPSSTSAHNTYPMTPVDCGCSIQQARLVAAAASIAFPPRSSTPAPTRAASSGPAATAPRVERTSFPSTIKCLPGK